MKRTLLLIIGLVFVVAACTHKSYAPAIITKDTTTVVVHHQDTTVVVDTTTYVFDTSVCFQRDILPIFLGSCAKSGCHDDITHKSSYNLTTYYTIMAKGVVKYNAAGSKLYTTCVSGKMPQSPTPKLDSTQLSYIRRWIDKGAPNDTGCAVNCNTNYTYAAGVKPIMQKYCYGCHATAAASSSGGNIILDTYTGVSAQVLNGKLLGDLNHTSGSNAMPLGGAKLPACMIEQVQKWIDAGAQNN